MTLEFSKETNKRHRDSNILLPAPFAQQFGDPKSEYRMK